MKVLITKDEHLQLGFRNKFRKPGWEEDVNQKHQFIIDHMIKNNIKIKITTGDIFDKQTNWTFKQFISNKKILEMYKEVDIEVYSIAGNHDMLDGRIDIKDSPFEEMTNEGLIKHLSLTVKDLSEDGITKAKVCGMDYRYIENDKDKEDFLSDLSTAFYNFEGVKMMVIHQNVTPDKQRVTEFTYDELSKVCQEKGIDIIVCGHYHIGYPTMELNGVVIINPWNLWRVVRDYNVKEELHTPEFVVLDLENMSWEHVTVPHKTYSNAFDLKEIDFYKNLKKENQSFFKFAENFKAIDSIDDDDDLKILKKFINESKEEFDLTDEDMEKIFSDLKNYFE